eukprot:gene3372-6672_t
MEKVVVLYKFEGDSYQSPNAFELLVSKGKDVYLIDILDAWKKSGVLDINYSFQACTRETTIQLESPASVIPVINNIISLILKPSAEPPQYNIDLSMDIIKKCRNDIARADAAYHRNKAKSSDKSKSRSNNTDETNRKVSDDLLGGDEMAALKVAAGEAAEAAAKHLINFATLSLKTAKQAAAALSGQIQVGHHKVTVIKELAEGGFGKVFLVRDLSTKTDYAMKQLLCQSKEQIEDATNELNALLKFRNIPTIINLIDHGSSSSKQNNGVREVLFLFPFYATGTTWNSIEHLLQDDPWPFPEWRALQIILDTARALQAIHSTGLSHRDMKPHNILINDDNNTILMDLGSVTVARVEIRNRQEALNLEDLAASKTSAPYRAPELTQVSVNTTVDERVDIWGLGCTLYCLAFGRSPFETPQEGVLRLAILNGRYTVPAGNRNRNCVFSNGFMNLIQSMLNPDHMARPFASDVIVVVQSLLANSQS